MFILKTHIHDIGIKHNDLNWSYSPSIVLSTKYTLMHIITMTVSIGKNIFI